MFPRLETLTEVNVPNDTRNSQVIMIHPRQPRISSEIRETGLGNESVVALSNHNVEAVESGDSLAGFEELIAESRVREEGLSGGLGDDGGFSVEGGAFGKLGKSIVIMEGKLYL